MLGRLSSVKLFEETPPGTLAPRDLPRLLDRTPHRLLKSPPVRASPKDSSKGSSKSSSKSSSTSRAQRRRAHQPGDAAADASGGGGSVHDPFDHDGEMQSLPSQDDAWDPDSSKRSSLAQVDAGAPILEEEDEEDDPRESGVCVSDLGLELWEEWRAEFPLEVLNSLAEFYEGCEVQEDGSRAACLGRVGEAISGALALGREAVDQEAAARGLVLPAPPLAGVARGGGGVQPAAPPGGEPEASASEDLQRWGRLLSFATLPGLLDLARGAVCRVEKDDPRRLWSADALLEVQLIFRRNMNALQRLPVAQLFQVLGSLGLEVLRADSVETQRWLVDVTKEVVHDRGTRASKLGVGSISFQEFLQIATVALREKERQRRRAAFQLEQAAWRAAGFRLLEAEDLRELHSAFVAAAENDSTVEMLRLLESCGVRRLRPAEVAALRAIVDHGGGGPARQPGAGAGATGRAAAEEEVPFHRFVVWMQRIYEEGLGDLSLQDKDHEAEAMVTLGELEHYSGFVAAMARERILSRSSARRVPAAAADGDALCAPDVPSGRRRSSVASSLGGSAPASRRSSLGLVLPLGRELSCGASKVSASRLPSRIVSLQASRATSRSASKAAAASRAASKVRGAGGSKARPLAIPAGGTRAGGPPAQPPAQAGGGAAEGGGGSSGVLQLKGLPPSEAMLGRKPFRPSSAVRSSVDHGGAQATAQPAAAPAADEGRGGADAACSCGGAAVAAVRSPRGGAAAPQLALSGSGSSGAPSAGGSAGSARRPWEPVAARQAEREPGRPAGGPGSPPGQGGAGSQPSAQRQVKTAQDASALVCGAVAKLESLLRERDASESVGPQTGDRPAEIPA